MDRESSGFSMLRVTLAVLKALLALLVAGWYVWQYFTPENRAVRQRLSEADAKSTAAMNQRLNPLHQLFAKGRKGSKEFAEEALPGAESSPWSRACWASEAGTPMPTSLRKRSPALFSAKLS